MTDELHLVAILDRSGSMSGTEKEVIGAYNSFIKEQQNIIDSNNIKAYTTLILFDHEYEQVYTKLRIDQVPQLTEKTYYSRGMTALYDAVGKTILLFEDNKKVIFFIETDGRENASKEFTGSTLKSLINKKKELGWDFNFVGADLNIVVAKDMGTSIGIDPKKILSFNKTEEGYTIRNTIFAESTLAYVQK